MPEPLNEEHNQRLPPLTKGDLVVTGANRGIAGMHIPFCIAEGQIGRVEHVDTKQADGKEPISVDWELDEYVLSCSHHRYQLRYAPEGATWNLAEKPWYGGNPPPPTPCGIVKPPWA